MDFFVGYTGWIPTIRLLSLNGIWQNCSNTSKEKGFPPVTVSELLTGDLSYDTKASLFLDLSQLLFVFCIITFAAEFSRV